MGLSIFQADGTATIEKSPIKLNYILENKFANTAKFYSSNRFTLNGCSSGYFYLTFNVNYTAVEPNFLSVALANGTKGITSDPTIDYRFYPNSIGYILYKTGGRSSYSPLFSSSSRAAGSAENIKYFIIHDETGSRLVASGLIITYLNITNTDTCLIASQATSCYPSSGDDGGGALSGVDALRNAASNTTVSTIIFSTITQSTTAYITISKSVSSPRIPIVTTTATTTVSATCADNQLPTNIIVTNSLTVKDSDLFFGFSDANGITKDAKFEEFQVGLKNGQNKIKDLVTANVKRSNLDKRQGSAKINIVYVNGIYSLLSNGQSFTTFKGTNIAPKSLTITPFDGTVTLSNFVLTCM
ncbi:hypothetical protein BB560_006059 [Smittium megazygosporum]|uniref:Uncharacterized protein n=1 Tax=Smittium megazygosporum TaxID=133381 RepID=A0A2T9YJ94_9FUNG|nr:hypothetical protein BB560_006059 [Smittium megazygosporum]